MPFPAAPPVAPPVGTAAGAPGPSPVPAPMLGIRRAKPGPSVDTMTGTSPVPAPRRMLEELADVVGDLPSSGLAASPSDIGVRGAREVLEVGQTWTDEDGSRARIVSIDDNTEYPVLFQWLGGPQGRATVGGFLRDFNRPTQEWLAAIERHTHALTERLRSHAMDAAKLDTEVHRLRGENERLRTDLVRIDSDWPDFEAARAEVSRLSADVERLRAENTYLNQQVVDGAKSVSRLSEELAGVRGELVTAIETARSEALVVACKPPCEHGECRGARLAAARIRALATPTSQPSQNPGELPAPLGDEGKEQP